jgi:hypothetical protein
MVISIIIAAAGFILCLIQANFYEFPEQGSVTIPPIFGLFYFVLGFVFYAQFQIAEESKEIRG